MKSDVQKALAQTLKDSEMAYETTVRVNFMTHVLARGRQVQASEIVVPPTQDQTAWITRDWREECLRIG